VFIGFHLWRFCFAGLRVGRITDDVLWWATPRAGPTWEYSRHGRNADPSTGADKGGADKGSKKRGHSPFALHWRPAAAIERERGKGKGDTHHYSSILDKGECPLFRSCPRRRPWGGKTAAVAASPACRSYLICPSANPPRAWPPSNVLLSSQNASPCHPP
jgi:hypothetical protein